MSRLHRYYVQNGIYFITGVTKNRIKFFKETKNVDLFWSNLRKTKQNYSFRLFGYVLLLDHFHFLIQPKESSISTIIGSFKKRVSQEYKKIHEIDYQFILWQRRFWDHVIRNEDDLKFHLDYIHYNPVKHNYVDHPEDWNETSFHIWLKKGEYEIGWGYRELTELMNAKLD